MKNPPRVHNAVTLFGGFLVRTQVASASTLYQVGLVMSIGLWITLNISGIAFYKHEEYNE